MEYKKDIKERGMEHRGINNGMIVFGATLSKKCERLATAMYLVTNFLLDTEPLKGHLRTLCVEMIRGSNALKAGGRVSEADVLDNIHSNIGEILSLLEIAFIAGLISEMNFTILKREFVVVRDVVDLQKVSRESRTDSILANDFFAPPEPSVFANEVKQSSIPAPIPPSPRNHQGHSIGHTEPRMSDRNTKGHTAPQSQSPSLRGGTTKLFGTLNSSSRSVSNIAIESRRVRILKLIKDNREVMIKDIVKHFPDLSEKTIQRELVSFVESGVLKKLGERRWSRYTLA